MANDRLIAEAEAESFLIWLRDAGASLTYKLALSHLRTNERGRGIVANAPLAEDEVIFSIPSSAALNVNTWTARYCNSDAYEMGLVLENAPPWLTLTAIIMHEILSTGSFWSPYLGTLPESLDTLIFWTAEELSELQASSVVQKIGKAEAEEMYNQSIRPLGLEGATLELFHRVASTIMAYAFDIAESENTADADGESENGDELIDDQEEPTTLTMIPLADMLNADGDRVNARLSYDTEQLEVKAMRPIASGEELFIDHGPLPSSAVLRRYGYVNDSSAPYDVVELSTTSIVSAIEGGKIVDEDMKTITYSTVDLQSRLELAQREDVFEDSYDVSYPGSEGSGIPDDLIALVYILVIDEPLISQFKNSSKSLPGPNRMITCTVAQVLRQILRLKESEYATSLEDDERDIQHTDSKRLAMAKKVRLGEKRVLRSAANKTSEYEREALQVKEKRRFEESTISQSKKKARTS